MATDPSFAESIVDLGSSVAGIRTKKMFGEYGLFVDDKMVGVLCDNQAFLKPTDAGRALLDEVVLTAPFPGAKDYILLDAALDDRDLFAQLLRTTAAALPAPKAKKGRAKEQTSVVMIHGLLGSLEPFQPAGLPKDFSITYPTLHGYGGRESETGEGSMSLDLQVEFLRDHIATLSAERVWLVGHSVGGALAMLFAARYPERVRGIVNIEGNFTLEDAFWSRQIALRAGDEWAEEYQRIQQDPAGWLNQSGVSPTAARTNWARQILAFQEAGTVRSMASAVVARTGEPEFLEAVRRVVDSGVPVRLYAGERSRPDWHVPEFLVQVAGGVVIHPSVGHLMMLEDPDGFWERLMAILRDPGTSRRGA